MNIAHISDLHVGRKKHDQSLLDLVKSLKHVNPGKIIVTGDITNYGLKTEYYQFLDIFQDLLSICIILPGNHDQMGDRISKSIMKERVEVVSLADTSIIKIDSTARYNKLVLPGHGQVCSRVLKMVEEALEAPTAYKIVCLHHHPTPLPEESVLESVSKMLGWPFTKELKLGKDLIDLCLDKVDLILHGHRHLASNTTVDSMIKPLEIYNAGSTPKLNKYRLFSINSKISNKWVNF